jgi:hypothetical protein
MLPVFFVLYSDYYIIILMSETARSEHPSLESKQSGDVIRYYYEGENEVSRENGWPYKIRLGQAAIHTTDPAHSLLPENEDGSKSATLTLQEMNAGLNYILEKESSVEPEEPAPTSLPKPPELRDDLPPNPAMMEALEARLDELVDSHVLSFYDAWRQVAQEFPELFKPPEKNS